MWLPDRDYFALGTDYDDQGNLRIIRTTTANPAALLDTGFFDTLPAAARTSFVEAIARTMFGPDFLTDAGIRSRALSAGDLVDHWDYHGSFVSWPKETYDIAKGLRRQGLPKLAQQLENRLLNIVLRVQEYPEFVYVDGWGRVLSGAPTTRRHGGVITILGNNKPERLQAWTVSAIMAIVSRRLAKVGRKKQPATHSAFEVALLATIPHRNRYINPLKLRSHYPDYAYRLARTPDAK